MFLFNYTYQLVFLNQNVALLVQTPLIVIETLYTFLLFKVIEKQMVFSQNIVESFCPRQSAYNTQK